MFTGEERVLDEELRRSYERFLKKYQDSPSYPTVKAYYEILKAEGFRFSDKVQEFLKANKLAWEDGD